MILSSFYSTITGDEDVPFHLVDLDNLQETQGPLPSNKGYEFDNILGDNVGDECGNDEGGDDKSDDESIGDIDKNTSHFY